MAKKISELDPITDVDGEDEYVLVRSGTTYKIEAEHLLGAKADKLLATNVQTSSYTLVLSDADTVIEMNSASANDLIIPLNSSVAFPVGTVIMIFQLGAGQTTIDATAGVDLLSPNGANLLTQQFSSAALRKRDTDEWVLTGDITSI